MYDYSFIPNAIVVGLGIITFWLKIHICALHFPIQIVGHKRKALCVNIKQCTKWGKHILYIPSTPYPWQGKLQIYWNSIFIKVDSSSCLILQYEQTFLMHLKMTQIAYALFFLILNLMCPILVKIPVLVGSQSSP